MYKDNSRQHRPGIAAIALTVGAALSMAFISSHVAAIGTEDSVNQKPLSAEFRKLDSNSDRQLSRLEASGDKDISNFFSEADIDQDGMLSIDEYTRFKSDIQQRRVAAYVDDATITARVKAELIRDAGLDGLDISVETHKGQVILSGFVNNGEQLLRAVYITSGVQGVQSVKNALVIKG
ncbi:MAG TPA: BON domain-containing protein [Methylophilaceae bacterium]|jgi:hyperosmotically inducible protein